MTQQRQTKAAFVAGEYREPVVFEFRDPGTNKKHMVAVAAIDTGKGDVLILSARRTSRTVIVGGLSVPVWEYGPSIALSSIFSLRPPPAFTSSEANVWRFVTQHFKEEIVAFERARLRQEVLPYERLQPRHLWSRENYEGPLSVPTEDGPLVVWRRICHIGEGLTGVSFVLGEPPVCHPFAASYVDAVNGGRDIATFGQTGFPFLTVPGSFQEKLTRVLMGHLVPTGTSQTFHRQ